MAQLRVTASMKSSAQSADGAAVGDGVDEELGASHTPEQGQRPAPPAALAADGHRSSANQRVGTKAAKACQAQQPRGFLPSRCFVASADHHSTGDYGSLQCSLLHVAQEG